MGRPLTAKERAAGEYIIKDDERIIKEQSKYLNSRNEHDVNMAKAEIAYRRERIQKIRDSLDSGIAPEEY